MTLSKMTLSIMTLSIITFSLMTLSIITSFSIMTQHKVTQHNDSQHNSDPECQDLHNMQCVIKPSVILLDTEAPRTHLNEVGVVVVVTVVVRVASSKPGAAVDPQIVVAVTKLTLKSKNKTVFTNLAKLRS
jgi:hypothetical protein